VFKLGLALFRLDYISCFLTVVATLLVGRKQWTGLVLAGINSAIVCVIGVKTAEYGFIPANVFCIVTYALSVRSWRRDKATSKSAPAETASPVHHQPRIKAASSSRSARFFSYSAGSYERWRSEATERLMRARSSARNSA
jgi:hypothetical protein